MNESVPLVKQNTVTINIKRHTAFPLPAYMTSHSAGMDIYADCTETIILYPGQRQLVPTGLFIEIPEGCEAQIRPRSGLALKHGVTLLNSPGTIDADYRGEIGIILINHGTVPFDIKPGDRIAQMIVSPVSRVIWNEIADTENTARGSGGFGHTGR